MRAEADHGNVLVGIRRDGAVDVAVLVEMGVANPHGKQFGSEQAAQVFLLLGGRAGRRFRIGLGVDHDIAQETLGHGVGKGEGSSQHDNLDQRGALEPYRF